MRTHAKRYSKEKKESLIKDWQSSGLSQSRYCDEHGIKQTTFSSWVRKSCKPRSKNFVPVELSEVKERRGTEFFLIKAGGVEIKIPLKIEDSLMSRIIREAIRCT